MAEDLEKINKVGIMYADVVNLIYHILLSTPTSKQSMMA